MIVVQKTFKAITENKSMEKPIIDNLSVEELLRLIESRRQNGEEIKLHPNGFLQLSLSSGHWREQGLRLHVWSDSLPRKNHPKFRIHDHIFDIESYILLGKIQNKNYIIRDDPEGEHLIVEAGLEDVHPTNKRVNAFLSDYFSKVAGEKYTLPRLQFHSSESEASLTATVMSKKNTNLTILPRVLAPVDYKTEELEGKRVVDQALAWDVVKLVVNKICETYL